MLNHANTAEENLINVALVEAVHWLSLELCDPVLE